MNLIVIYIFFSISRCWLAGWRAGWLAGRLAGLAGWQIDDKTSNTLELVSLGGLRRELLSILRLERCCVVLGVRKIVMGAVFDYIVLYCI